MKQHRQGEERKARTNNTAKQHRRDEARRKWNEPYPKAFLYKKGVCTFSVELFLGIGTYFQLIC